MVYALTSKLITLIIIAILLYLSLALAGSRWKVFKSAASGFASLSFAILGVFFILWRNYQPRQGIGNLVLDDPPYEDDEELLWN